MNTPESDQAQTESVKRQKKCLCMAQFRVKLRDAFAAAKNNPSSIWKKPETLQPGRDLPFIGLVFGLILFLVLAVTVHPACGIVCLLLGLGNLVLSVLGHLTEGREVAISATTVSVLVVLCAIGQTFAPAGKVDSKPNWEGKVVEVAGTPEQMSEKSDTDGDTVKTHDISSAKNMPPKAENSEVAETAAKTPASGSGETASEKPPTKSAESVPITPTPSGQNATKPKANGLFSGLAKQQDEADAAKKDFETFFTSYDSNKFFKGELGKNKDGTPSIAIDNTSGEAKVDVVITVDTKALSEWEESAKKILAKHAEITTAPNKAPNGNPIVPKEAGNKPCILIGKTLYVFPSHLKKVIDDARNKRRRLHPGLAVFMVDADGMVIAEPKGAQNARYSLQEEIAIYTCKATYEGRNKETLSVGDAATLLACGVDDMSFMADFDGIGIPMAIGEESRGIWRAQRHGLDFHDINQLEQCGDGSSKLWWIDVKMPTGRMTISFGQLPSEKLAMVQDIRVCVGGYQYRDFLRELKGKGFGK